MGSSSSVGKQEATTCCSCLDGLSGRGARSTQPEKVGKQIEQAAAVADVAIQAEKDPLSGSHTSFGSTAAPASEVTPPKALSPVAPLAESPGPPAKREEVEAEEAADGFDPDAVVAPLHNGETGDTLRVAEADAPSTSPWQEANTEVSVAAMADQGGGFADFSSAPPAPLPATPPAQLAAADLVQQMDSKEARREHQRQDLASPGRVGHLFSGAPHELRHFSIEVPEPFPGVQYRATKCLDDRMPRFAVRGEVVAGYMEDGGWIRTEAGQYLPAKVGDLHVLVPCSAQSQPPTAPAGASASGMGFLACCRGSTDRAAYAGHELLLNEE